MIVPRYWAEGRAQFRSKGKQHTVRRFGWSDESDADAQDMADRRAKEALADVVAGKQRLSREPKVPYNGAEGVPIREEIVETHGDVVITRNSYGARCLNTPDVVFADVDFEQPAGCAGNLGPAVVGIGLGLFAAWKFSSVWLAIGSVFLAGPLAMYLAFLARSFWIGLRGGDERVAHRRILAFSERHPDWHLRVYRTFAGFRVLVMHRTFTPASTEVEAFFEALGTDRLYRRMCERQRCFRARLTPKPWRIGFKLPLKPRPGVWPVKPEHLPRRRQWVDEYEARSRDFSACRFVARFGAETTCDAAERVRELHDDACGATSDRPIG